MGYGYLLDIALILITTKVFGLLTRRVQLPQVVGALLAGLILGPACLGWLQNTDFLSQVSELGVIVIMFSAGIGTDLKELRKTGKAGLLVALCGVLVPLGLGFALMSVFNKGEFSYPGDVFLQNLFMGTILTATSVSITVETLKEMGKLSTKVGNTILAAALIDDVLGLICLTLVTSMAGSDVSILVVLLKVLAFFVFVCVVGFLMERAIRWYETRVHEQNLHRFPIAAFVLCLLMAYVAEEWFGVADIIGAFAAGLVISCTSKASYVESKFSVLSYLLLSPVFFASIGLKVTIPKMDAAILLFTVLLVIVAVVSKLIGCGLGAKFSGFKTRQCVQVGCGMVCRGEVALIVADKGMALNLLNPVFSGPIVIMIVFCAIFTPLLLKLVFHGEPSYETLEQSDLADRYERVEQLDIISNRLLDEEAKKKKQ